MENKRTFFQHYRDEDYEAVCDFLIELNRQDKTHVNWNWARFEWMAEHPEFNKSTRTSIGLWRSEDKIVGAAIYDMYFGEAFCGTMPEYEALYPEILDYAYRELKDGSGLAAAINAENTAEIRTDQVADRRALEWLFWQGFDHGDDREAFNRAKALGAKTAYVISDLPFYEKLGFETVQLYTFYRKASSSEE